MSPEQFYPSCACDTVCLLVLVCLQRVPRLPCAGHGPGLGEHALLHTRLPVHGHVQCHDPEGVWGCAWCGDGAGKLRSGERKQLHKGQLSALSAECHSHFLLWSGFPCPDLKMLMLAGH